MCLEQKRSDNPKVAATTAYGPKEIGIFLCTRCYKAAIGQHQIDAQQIIDSETILTREIADPTAKRQPTHTCAGYDTAGHCQAKGMRRMIDIRPHTAAFDPYNFVGWIDA